MMYDYQAAAVKHCYILVTHIYVRSTDASLADPQNFKNRLTSDVYNTPSVFLSRILFLNYTSIGKHSDAD